MISVEGVLANRFLIDIESITIVDKISGSYANHWKVSISELIELFVSILLAL